MRRGNAGLPPLLQVVPSPTVDTDAVLIYTTDGLVHQFHSFARTKTMENFINIIDHVRAKKEIFQLTHLQLGLARRARFARYTSICGPCSPSGRYVCSGCCGQARFVDVSSTCHLIKIHTQLQANRCAFWFV